MSYISLLWSPLPCRAIKIASREMTLGRLWAKMCGVSCRPDIFERWTVVLNYDFYINTAFYFWTDKIKILNKVWHTHWEDTMVIEVYSSFPSLSFLESLRLAKYSSQRKNQILFRASGFKWFFVISIIICTSLFTPFPLPSPYSYLYFLWPHLIFKSMSPV